MNKSLIAAAIGCVALAGASGAASARDLTVTSWGGAYQEAQEEVYFDPFRAETGIPLLAESWNGGIGVLRTQVMGGNPVWDVVQVESEELELGCAEGLLEEIDWERVGGEDRYIDAAVHPCGVGAIVYNFIIGYDKDALDQPPSGVSDFFNLEKYPGKRGMRNGPKTNLELALMADGVPADQVYEVLSTDEGVDRAFAKLDEIKDQIVFWEAGAQPPQLLASGEVALTTAYNGRIDAANKEDGRNFGILWDNSLYTLDSWVILRDSPNADQAYDLIEFMGRAENQAKLPLEIAYGVTNPEANEQIPPERLAELPTAEEHMESALQISDEFWIENIDQLTERWSRWASTN